MSKRFKLRDLEVVEGTICDEPMNPEAKVVLFKRRPAQKENGDMSKKNKTTKNAPVGTENTDPLKALGLTPEQEEAVRELIESARKASEEEQEKAAQPADEELIGKENGEDEDKEAAEDEDKEARKSRRTLSKAEREIAILRKQLEDERNERLNREALDKAREFPSIPVKREKLASLIRAVGEKLEKSYGETLEQVLRACDQLATSNEQITKSIGKANGLDDRGRSASDEIDEIAAGIMKSNPNLPRSEAIAKAWESRPDLVKKARQETGGR